MTTGLTTDLLSEIPLQQPIDQSQNRDNSYRRTVFRRLNTTTITRQRTIPPRVFPAESRTQSRQEPESRRPLPPDDELFGPVRITDTELNPPTGTGFNFRKYNVSVAHGTSRTKYTGVGPREPTPILWQNRTWHWSSNRNRPGYDPDLDGTTLPPDEFYDPIPPLLREPYETRFYPWGIQTVQKGQLWYSCYSINFPGTCNPIHGQIPELLTLLPLFPHAIQCKQDFHHATKAVVIPRPEIC